MGKSRLGGSGRVWKGRGRLGKPLTVPTVAVNVKEMTNRCRKKIKPLPIFFKENAVK